LYVLYGGNYFLRETRDKWLLGSNNNGACHAIRKIKLPRIKGYNLKDFYVYLYNHCTNKKMALWAFGKI